MREAYNCAFCYPIYSDPTSGYATVVSGGSWLAALPAANVQDRRFSKVARSTNDALSSTKMVFDLTAQVDVRALFVDLPNASRDAKVRFRGGNDGDDPATDFASPVYDTGWIDVYGEIYPPDVLPWGHPALFDGRPTQAMWNAGFRMPFIHVATEPQMAQYWLMEIDDTANEDGYVDVGRVIIAPAYQTIVDMSQGSKLGLDDASSSDMTEGGNYVYNRRVPVRKLVFTLDAVEMGEALAMLFDMQQAAGVTRQMLFISDPTDTYHMHRRSFPCVFETLSPLDFVQYNSMGVPFAVREDR